MNSTARNTVEFDAEIIIRMTTTGQQETIHWADICSVSISTNPERYKLGIYCWLLESSKGGGCLIPSNAIGIEAVEVKLKSLPQFDSLQFEKAANSKADALFQCWKSARQKDFEEKWHRQLESRLEVGSRKEGENVWSFAIYTAPSEEPFIFQYQQGNNHWESGAATASFEKIKENPNGYFERLSESDCDWVIPILKAGFVSGDSDSVLSEIEEQIRNPR